MKYVFQIAVILSRSQLVNSLWSNVAKYYLWSWYSLVQKIAWCHMAASHYLNQCWFVTSGTISNMSQINSNEYVRISLINWIAAFVFIKLVFCWALSELIPVSVQVTPSFMPPWSILLQQWVGNYNKNVCRHITIMLPPSVATCYSCYQGITKNTGHSRQPMCKTG